MGKKQQEERLRVEHLKMLQANINRFSSNSFRLKQWAVALTLAILAFLSTSDKAPSSTIYLLAIASVVVFWVLDAYYLSLERNAIKIFDESRLDTDKPTKFLMMKHIRFCEKVIGVFSALFSISTLVLYATLLFVVLIVAPSTT